MLLSPMRYKDYTWPHNPETYEVSYQRQMAAHKLPLGGWCVQDLGRTHRVFQGEGVFIGTRAYEDFQELAEVFFQEGAGLLVHPVWRAVSAYFVTLELLEEPRPDYVHYSFSFLEAGSEQETLTQIQVPAAEESDGAEVSGEAQRRGTHLVRKGDTLWAIAGEYGVELTELIRANPQIKNPNLIYPGEQVVIP